MLCHISLSDHYRLNFELLNKSHDHNFDLTSIDNLIPFERDVYIGLLHKYMTEKHKETG